MVPFIRFPALRFRRFALASASPVLQGFGIAPGENRQHRIRRGASLRDLKRQRALRPLHVIRVMVRAGPFHHPRIGLAEKAGDLPQRDALLRHPGRRFVAPGRSRLAGAIRYALKLWDGLVRFLDDGRLEIDTNTVERAMLPIALNRKNALFAGSDRGGELWAVIASLIETCKLNAVDPQACLTDALERLVAGHPRSRIDELTPRAYPAR
jgi:hypothetical protein